MAEPIEFTRPSVRGLDAVAKSVTVYAGEGVLLSDEYTNAISAFFNESSLENDRIAPIPTEAMFGISAGIDLAAFRIRQIRLARSSGPAKRLEILQEEGVSPWLTMMVEWDAQKDPEGLELLRKGVDLEYEFQLRNARVAKDEIIQGKRMTGAQAFKKGQELVIGFYQKTLEEKDK